MGCDIHMVLEKRIKRRWVGVNAFPYVHATVYAFDDKAREHKSLTGSTHWQVRDRNYNLFAALAGVRGEGPLAKGVPDDVSDLAQMEIDRWGADGHSHSWMLMGEALPIFIVAGQLGPQAAAVLSAFQNGTEHALDDYMENFWSIDPDSETLDDYRLVFWFDN